MQPRYFFDDDYEDVANLDYRVIPEVQIGPGQDVSDVCHKMVDLLASDLALDSSQLDLEGLN